MDNTNTTTQYQVKLLVEQTFDVKATSMDHAVIKALSFYDSMPNTWGTEADVAWHDEQVIRQSVSQAIE